MRSILKYNLTKSQAKRNHYNRLESQPQSSITNKTYFHRFPKPYCKKTHPNCPIQPRKLIPISSQIPLFNRNKQSHVILNKFINSVSNNLRNRINYYSRTSNKNTGKCFYICKKFKIYWNKSKLLLRGWKARMKPWFKDNIKQNLRYWIENSLWFKNKQSI